MQLHEYMFKSTIYHKLAYTESLISCKCITVKSLDVVAVTSSSLLQSNLCRDRDVALC